MTNPLETLNKIAAYGKSFYNGQHYSIKYAMKATEDLMDRLTKLKGKHPELVIYKAKTTNRVLFGGTFHVNSSFAYDRVQMLGLKK